MCVNVLMCLGKKRVNPGFTGMSPYHFIVHERKQKTSSFLNCIQQTAAAVVCLEANHLSTILFSAKEYIQLYKIRESWSCMVSFPGAYCRNCLHFHLLCLVCSDVLLLRNLNGFLAPLHLLVVVSQQRRIILVC